MEITNNLYSLNLTGRLMFLLQMMASSVMADEARLFLVLISFVELPSFVITDPKYLKLSKNC